MSIESRIAEILEESQLEVAEEELTEEEPTEEEPTEEEAGALDEEELDEITSAFAAARGRLRSNARHAAYDVGKGAASEIKNTRAQKLVHQTIERNKKGGLGDAEYGQQGQGSGTAHRDMNPVMKSKLYHTPEAELLRNKRPASPKLNSEYDISADVDALLFGEDLSEEFRTKATTIFEAAVISRVRDEVAKLEEEFEEKLAEQVDSITEGLVEKIDGYLDYVVEQWIEQNEIALESGIKSDITESFISGMKGLFEEHYIDVPAERYDMLGEMEAKIDELEEKLDEQVSKNIGLKKSLSEATRKDIVKMVSEGLTSTETEKFSDLVEELSYEDEETFQTKVQTIRENYFTGTPSTRRVQSVVTDSPVEELNEESKQVIDPAMAVYLEALKKHNQ